MACILSDNTIFSTTNTIVANTVEPSNSSICAKDWVGSEKSWRCSNVEEFWTSHYTVANFLERDCRKVRIAELSAKNFYDGAGQMYTFIKNLSLDYCHVYTPVSQKISY